MTITELNTLDALLPNFMADEQQKYLNLGDQTQYIFYEKLIDGKKLKLDTCIEIS